MSDAIRMAGEPDNGVVRKIEKLLALANGNDNEHQAQSAMEKALELAEAYNLDIANIGGAKDKQRKDNRLKGGLYPWQRTLWNAIAALNFCHYSFSMGLQAGSKYEHRLIGSHVNVVSAQVMAEYLQGAIERMARAEARQRGLNIFTRAMIAYREGLADRITLRLDDIRRARVAEDKRKQAENAARARHPNAPATGNALVLADVIQTEHDLNTDYLEGLEPGTTARRRAEREARQAAAMAAYDQRVAEQAEWDLAHPEEAAARIAAEKAASEKWYRAYEKRQARRKNSEPRPRALSAQEKRQRMAEYRDGWHDGDRVSLDDQIDKQDRKGIK